MKCSTSFNRLALIAMVAIAIAMFWPGSVSAQANRGDACVRDFFTVARVDYGLSPEGVVQFINTDGDPNYQVANVGDLVYRVANAELGIFDASGNYHICPNP